MDHKGTTLLFRLANDYHLQLASKQFTVTLLLQDLAAFIHLCDLEQTGEYHLCSTTVPWNRVKRSANALERMLTAEKRPYETKMLKYWSQVLTIWPVDNLEAASSHVLLF
jgi:hypothetical protein